MDHNLDTTEVKDLRFGGTQRELLLPVAKAETLAQAPTGSIENQKNFDQTLQKMHDGDDDDALLDS